MLAVTAFWLGCNTAAREIVREQALHRRERGCGLSPAAYLLAKWAVLSIVAGLQATLLYGITSYLCGLPGHDRPMIVLLAAVAATGVAAGLLASAASSSETVALALVPVLVIPQIVLSDAFEPLSGTVARVAEFTMSVHHGFRGLLPCLRSDLAAIVAPSGVSVGGATLSLIVQCVLFLVIAWKILDILGRPRGLYLSIPLLSRGGIR